MRKVLLIAIITLLVVLSVVTVVKGVKISKIDILSIDQLKENHIRLDNRAKEVDALINVEYKEKEKELTSANNKMQEIKKKYLDETNLSSDEDIQNALEVENFDLERLYIKLGNHANKEGVNLKFVLNPASSGTENTKDISFTVQGTYIAITNFVYAIEDDSELNFRIYNFKVLPNDSEILQATFTVKDIRITSNSLNESLTSSIQTTENTNDKKDESGKNNATSQKEDTSKNNTNKAN